MCHDEDGQRGGWHYSLSDGEEDARRKWQPRNQEGARVDRADDLDVVLVGQIQQHRDGQAASDHDEGRRNQADQRVTLVACRIPFRRLWQLLVGECESSIDGARALEQRTDGQMQDDRNEAEHKGGNVGRLDTKHELDEAEPIVVEEVDSKQLGGCSICNCHVSADDGVERVQSAADRRRTLLDDDQQAGGRYEAAENRP